MGEGDRNWIMQTQGHKDDSGKIRYDLIPAGPLHLLAALYTLGAVKYDDENWRKGISYKRLFAALMRHAWAWMRGERVDPETGLSHMVAVAWCAFSILEFETQHRKESLDTRYYPPIPTLDLSEFEAALKTMIAKRKTPEKANDKKAKSNRKAVRRTR